MINPALIDRIDKYLLGQLSAEEAQQFLTELKQNPDDQEILELVQKIGPAYQDELVADLKAKMLNWDKEESLTAKPILKPNAPIKPSPKITRRSWLSAAAVGILLLAASLYFFQGDKVLSGPELFAQHFEPYPYAGIERSADVQANQAYILYNAGQYEAAIEEFSELDDIQSLFYLGQAQLATKQYKPAITSLEAYLSNQGPFQSQAKWSLALSYLALNMLDKSQEILISLATENSSYGKKAVSLIALMK